MSFEWHEDVIRPLETRFIEYGPVAERGPDRCIRVKAPLFLQAGDIIVNRGRLRDRFLRLRRAPELALVTFAGGTFTWIQAGYAGSVAHEWRRGDRLYIIGVLVR